VAEVPSGKEKGKKGETDFLADEDDEDDED